MLTNDSQPTKSFEDNIGHNKILLFRFFYKIGLSGINSYKLTMNLKLSECKILSSLDISFDNVQNYDGIYKLISIFARIRWRGLPLLPLSIRI